MIAVASYGVNIAKEAINGAKTTAESVKEAFLSTKQAFKDIISGKGLKDVTIETITGEIQKSPQQIVKDTITSELKKHAMGELLEKTSQCLADELWVKHQAKKIRRVVRQELTKAFTTNELITHALKIDRDQQNSSWQQCFLGEAHEILNNMLKSDPRYEVLKEIGKGIMYNTEPYSKEVVVGAGVLNAIRKSCSNKSDTITPLTKTFIEAFNKRIAIYKNDIEQSKQANQEIQETMSRSNQTTAMADPPPINLDNQDIIIAKVNNISDFRPPDRSANQIRLEESFPNLGPSTPENLVGELEEYICGATIQNINDEIMSGASYGANWVNNQIFKKETQYNQRNLNALEARAMNRYVDIKTEKQQKKLYEQALREMEQDKELNEKETSSSKQPNGQAKSKKQSILDPHTEKAIEELQEGGELTRAHIRMVASLLPSPIYIVDESGQPLGEEIGGYKSGEPIVLRALRDKNGKVTHIEPLNLTPKQKKQYESLNHTKKDCVLNTLFVHLPEVKQKELRDIEGMRKYSADYMREHPELCRDIFKYQEKLRQLAPAEVPRMGFLPVFAAAVVAVELGSACWAAFQGWQACKNIANDKNVQENWKDGKYINSFRHSLQYFPLFEDAIHGLHAWERDDYRGTCVHTANALWTFYGGKVIGKGGKWLAPKLNNMFRQLRGGKNLKEVYNNYETVLNKFINHGLRKNRNADLGLSTGVIASNSFKLVAKKFPLLKAGDNTILVNINGIQKSFKVFVQGGKVKSVNMFPGVSKRKIKWNLIKSEDVTWR